MFPCYQYYLEIKNRILLLLFTWASLLIVCYHFKEPLLFTFIDSNKYYNTVPYFIFTNVDEIFYVYLRLVFFIANQITFVIGLYHGLMFLALGLYHSEYNQLKSIVKIFIVTWLCSIILLKKIVVPFSWSFFLSFQETNDHLQPASFFFEARILEYFNYFTNFYYICMANCQLLALTILFLNNVSEKIGTVKTFRKLFYLIFILFSTITTPPDIFSQIIMSSSLILIYELLIFVKYIKT
uniref:Sec-independent protein translocase component TatC n=1 Tax=Pseudo-nitzschia delicatissima TaxID=44447 RepID=A0A8B6QMX6_9STRA|nr:Sec-independent protein translocase component TatC [Pseudo-nitzschia delicatissima]QTJ30069.1 Sec-independent protein translocase component TatC [Pseudo-nitzschia delicatissima]